MCYCHKTIINTFCFRNFFITFTTKRKFTMDSDQLSNEFVEIDCGDKENVNQLNIRQPKTTTAQFDMIYKFMKDNNEELIDKATFSLLWDDLAAKLNDIGPPDHTVTEWKRIWSVHKYNRNRKRSTDALDFYNPGKAPRQDESSHLVEPLEIVGEDVEVVSEDVVVGEDVVVVGVGSSETYERNHNQSAVLEKLEVLIENQITMIGKQDVIIHLLEEIAKKA